MTSLMKDLAEIGTAIGSEFKVGKNDLAEIGAVIGNEVRLIQRPAGDGHRP